jgi:hypothetical protein
MVVGRETVLRRFVGQIQFAGGPVLLKFRMEFEQIQGLLEELLNMCNNYIWAFLELLLYMSNLT